MTDNISIDHRTAAEVEAEAREQFLKAEQQRRDRPTGDEDEDAFLRAFRKLIADAEGRFTTVEDERGRVGSDSYEIETAKGVIDITFVDPFAREKVVDKISIANEIMHLSLAAKSVLWGIVREETRSAAIHKRDSARREKLRNFARGVQS